MSEEFIQRNALSVIKHYFPDILISVSLNGEVFKARDKSTLGFYNQLKQNHFLKGIPDVTLFLPDGKVLNLEFKKPNTGKQSKEQLEVEQWLKSLNHNYFVVTSTQEVLDVLTPLLSTDFIELQKTKVTVDEHFSRVYNGKS